MNTYHGTLYEAMDLNLLSDNPSQEEVAFVLNQLGKNPIVDISNRLLESNLDICITGDDGVFPKSVLRAIIAHIAILGNISPYGGEGRVVVGSKIIEVSIINTPQRQVLELKAKPPGICGGFLADHNAKS